MAESVTKVVNMSSGAPATSSTTTRYETRMEVRADAKNPGEDLDRIWSRIKEDMFGKNAPTSEQTTTTTTTSTSQESAVGRTSPTAILTEDQFQVSVPVTGFKAEELSVKVMGDRLVVEAEREEKKEDNGTVVRQQWKKSFVLPKSVDAEALTSSLSSDGVLTITAPKKPPTQPLEELKIPIKTAPPPAAQ